MKKNLLRFLEKGDPRFRFLSLARAPRVILELGCGDGSNLALAGRLAPGAELLGVDLLSAAAAPSFVRYSRVDLDSEPLPFADGSVDIILFCHVLEHLAQPLKVAAEIRRVLKPGGRVYLEAPNWTSVLVPSFGLWREQHNPFNFYDDPTHLKPWSKHGLYAYLEQQVGLKVDALGTVRNWRRIWLDPLLLIYGLLRGKRSTLVLSFWNLYGWAIFASGKKPGGPGDSGT